MDVDNQRCPNCAGSLITSDEVHKKICLFCGSEFEIDSNDNIQKDIFEEIFGRIGLTKNNNMTENVNSHSGLHYDREQLCKLFLSQIGDEKKEFRMTPELQKGLHIPNNEVVFLAHDDTLFKNGKNGFAITENGIYSRELWGKPKYISYSELRKIDSLRWNDSLKGNIKAGDFTVSYCFIADDRIKDKLMELMNKILKSTKENT